MGREKSALHFVGTSTQQGTSAASTRMMTSSRVLYGSANDDSYATGIPVASTVTDVSPRNPSKLSNLQRLRERMTHKKTHEPVDNQPDTVDTQEDTTAFSPQSERVVSGTRVNGPAVSSVEAQQHPKLVQRKKAQVRVWMQRMQSSAASYKARMTAPKIKKSQAQGIA